VTAAEVAADRVGRALFAMHEAAHVGHQVVEVLRRLAADGVGLDVLIEELIGIELDSGPASEAVPPDDPFVTIASFGTVVASEACRSALTATGFTVIGEDQFVLQVDPALGPALGGFRLGVRASEAEDARRFLAAADNGELAEGLLACSACGSGRRTTR
jgi:hypothetical protein